MNKINTPGFHHLLWLIILTVFFSCNNTEDSTLSLRDRVDQAMAQEREMTMDPATGTVPRERLLAAKAYRDGMAQYKSAVNGINWINLGPKNQGGRTRALLIDANDATGHTVFAGSVGGGLWKTTDITAVSPNWTPVNDFLGNLAITYIVQHPTTPNTMYLCTGEPYYNSDAIQGFGVWKSIDGGSSWSQLASTTGANYQFCYKMMISTTGSVFVATREGLFRSTDGGSSFTKVLGDGMVTGASDNRCYDVEQAANGDLFASLHGSIHKSTNDGVSFGAAMTLPAITTHRIELACAPSSADTVYAICSESTPPSGHVVSGIIRTTNGGTTWTLESEPVDDDGGISPTDFSRNQAWYDLAIAVDPNHAGTLIVGAIDLFKSTDGAGTWSQFSHWFGGFGHQYVHSDHHHVYFKSGSSSEFYVVNDGGVYRTTTGTATSPTLDDKGTNYVTVQFFGSAMHPTATHFLVGSQDNGTHKFSSTLMQGTIEVTGGDGAFCNIDQDQPLFQFTQYVRNQYRRSTNGGLSFSNVNFSGSTGRFINPSDYDNTNNILYAAGTSSDYFRWNDPQTGNSSDYVPVSFGGQVSSVKVSPNVNNQVYFGANSNLFRVGNAHTNSPSVTNISTGLPTSGYLSCIEVETGNENHILVCYSNFGLNSVWETIDGGTSWTSIEGNLPDMPIRWIIFHPQDNDQAFVATDLGVWSTDNLNGNSTNWGSTNSGLANVRVDMIESRPSDNAMIAATHGRGLFYSSSFLATQAAFEADKQLIYQGQSIQFTSTSINATSYLWDFGDGFTSNAQNPNHTFATAGIFTVSLSINGALFTETKTNYVQVLPNLAVPYTPAMGGDFESNNFHFAPVTVSGTPWEKGNSTISAKSGTNSGANAYTTGLTVSNYDDNSESYLYTPSFIMSNPGVYTLTFYRKNQFEIDYDGVIVESSIDNGATWVQVGNTISANWYDNAFPNTNAFAAGVAKFNGTKTAYTLCSHDVSNLSGNGAVAFRFIFKSDVSANAAGISIDDFSLIGPLNAPLPLESITCHAAQEGINNVVTWHTLGEQNIQSFDIERSLDGIHFEKIGTTQAANKATGEYTFLDAQAIYLSSTIQYYRIAVRDVDNKISYSNVAKLIKFNQQTELTIFPNPCSTHIDISSSRKIKAVQLVSPNGRVILSSRSLVNNRLLLPSALSRGIYVLRIELEGNVIIKRIVKE